MSSSSLLVRRILLPQAERSANASTTCRHARHYTTSKTTCPFATLGLTKSSDPSYAEVKSRFQKLALKHHPDRLSAVAKDKEKSDGKTEKQRKLAREEATKRFVRYRMAFEAIVESDDGSGLAILKEDADKVLAEENDAASQPNYNTFRHTEPQAFHNLAGFAERVTTWVLKQHVPPNYDDMSQLRVDPQLLHDVAEVSEDMAPGGLDKGGMWQLAADMREKAKRGDLPPLQVSEGESNGRQGKSTRRRRRKK